jgi:hypothetical protein
MLEAPRSTLTSNGPTSQPKEDFLKRIPGSWKNWRGAMDAGAIQEGKCFTKQREKTAEVGQRKPINSAAKRGLARAASETTQDCGSIFLR